MDSFLKYVPMVMICRIAIGGVKQFHSTMLLVPNEAAAGISGPLDARRERAHAAALWPIGFEVTRPDRSYFLPNRDYSGWHDEAYYAVDALFYAPLAGIDIDNVVMGDLDLHDL